jgi:hypothetical protein
MPEAFRRRPLSEILAPAAEPEAEGQTESKRESAPEQKQESDLPEKYRGKTAAEIAEMHLNAEKRLGQLQNEVGQLRGLVTDLSSIQRKPQEPETTEQVEVSRDEFLDDPTGAVNKVLSAELGKRDKLSEKEAAERQLQMELNALTQNWDVDAIVTTEEFQRFASRTPSRQQDLMTAAQGDGLEQVRAARRLLEDYDDFVAEQKARESAEKTESPVEKAKRVATERGSSNAPISGKPKIYEADVIELINSDPIKYRSPSFQKELTAAIREGRFVKN